MARKPAANKNGADALPVVLDDPPRHVPPAPPKPIQPSPAEATASEIEAILTAGDLPADLLAEMAALQEKAATAGEREPSLAEIAHVLTGHPVAIRLLEAPANPLPVLLNGRLLATLRVGERVVVPFEVLAVLRDVGAGYSQE